MNERVSLPSRASLDPLSWQSMCQRYDGQHRSQSTCDCALQSLPATSNRHLAEDNEKYDTQANYFTYDLDV